MKLSSTLKILLEHPNRNPPLLLCVQLQWPSKVSALKAIVNAVENGFTNPSSGFSGLCTGDTAATQAVSLLPHSQRMVVVLFLGSGPGFKGLVWAWKQSCR